MVINLDDAGYWNSQEQCLAADEIRSLIGLLAKAYAELDELKETCISHAQIQNALLAERESMLLALRESNEAMRGLLLFPNNPSDNRK